MLLKLSEKEAKVWKSSNKALPTIELVSCRVWGFKLAAQRWQVCGPASPVFVFISLYLRGGVEGGQRDKKRQSNQLGFQVLYPAFTLLIRYSSNSPLPKNTHSEATLMKSEVQPCQPTMELPVDAAFFFFLFVHKRIQPSNILQKDPMSEMLKCHLHIFPGGDEVLVLAALQTCTQSSHVMIRQLRPSWEPVPWPPAGGKLPPHWH